MVVQRFEIYWVELDPTTGTEMQKTRPAVIVSPSEMNAALGTVLVAPVTSRKRLLPTRIAFELNGVENYAALDQIRAVDKTRLSKQIAVLSETVARELCSRLQEMFAY